MKRPSKILGLTAALVSGVSGAAYAQGFDVKATREGLVGRKTATGHVIVKDDWFVALPSRKALGRYITVTYKGKTVRVPVKDVGPWNTKDDYWNGTGVPHAETGYDKFGRKTNGAGIDLADGVSKALGCGDMCQVTWEFEE